MKIHRRDEPRNPDIFKFLKSTRSTQLLRMCIRALKDAGVDVHDTPTLTKALEDMRFRANTSGKGSPDHQAKARAAA